MHAPSQRARIGLVVGKENLRIGTCLLATLLYSEAAFAQNLCQSPVTPFNTSQNPGTVVGNGTPASCTEAALRNAIAPGGVVTFDCGPNPVTIKINNQIDMTSKVDTIIDGKGKITLDGQDKTRILSLQNGGFLSRTIKVVIQNMTFINGNSISGPTIPPAEPPCAEGYYKEAGGGAIYIRDAITHIINSKFTDNRGAPVGPDVGGGAVFLQANLDSVISGSTFARNRASSGGAVGAINGNVRLYNTVFRANTASGFGGNNVDLSCPSERRGSGGLGGAVYLDGSESADIHVCGTQFLNNTAGHSAGAMFRTKNSSGKGNIHFDRVIFDRNTAAGAAGALFIKNYVVNVKESTFSHNTATATIGGAINAVKSTINFTNNTFYANKAAQLGGAIYALNTGGTINHQTFHGNRTTASNGFSAVIQSQSAPAPITIRNSVMVANTSRHCGPPMSCGGGTFTGVDNLQWPRFKLCDFNTKPDTTCTPGTTFQDPGIGDVLARNGGPTPNILPPSSSPARGVGSNCPSRDQRGKPRAADGCTVGSVEKAR
jgi:hypothetical protein